MVDRAIKRASTSRHHRAQQEAQTHKQVLEADVLPHDKHVAHSLHREHNVLACSETQAHKVLVVHSACHTDKERHDRANDCSPGGTNNAPCRETKVALDKQVVQANVNKRRSNVGLHGYLSAAATTQGRVYQRERGGKHHGAHDDAEVECRELHRVALAAADLHDRTSKDHAQQAQHDTCHRGDNPSRNKQLVCAAAILLTHRVRHKRRKRGVNGKEDAQHKEPRLVGHADGRDSRGAHARNHAGVDHRRERGKQALDNGRHADG